MATNGDYDKVSDPDEEDEDSSTTDMILTCCAACCGLICCGIAVGVIVLCAIIGPVGWIILGGSIGIFIVVFLVVFCIHQITIQGRTFHLFNYYLPMLKYGIISQMKGEKGVRDFWRAQVGDTPYLANGLGPVTETILGWQEAYEALSSWGAMIANGTMMHANELGLAIMGPAPFPETGTIIPTSNEDHGIVRPFMGRSCDGGKDQPGGWNRQLLRQMWRDRFDGLEEGTFNTSDTFWMFNVMLHKVLLNLDLTDDEAKEYLAFPCGLDFPGTGKMGVGLANMTYREMIFKFCTPVPCFQCKIQDHAELIKDALVNKFPGEEWDDKKLALTANFYNTAFLYAGGLSVPTVMMNMLAWWFTTEGRPTDLDTVRADDEDSIKNFMWETMRRNPPVAGVPRWVTDDGGDTWKHQVANIEQCMQDERVFPDPMTFKMGRPGLNAQDNSKSMLFSDFTMVNNDVSNPDSHSCPGKQLACEAIIAFWQEFLLREWDTDTESITVGYNLTTTFDLTQSS